MTKKCFVPRCKSGYKTCKEKVSLFRVPNNEALLKKWQDAIARPDRVISRKDHVCEKHFQEDDIVRYWIYRDIKDKLKTPRLKKNAVPCIFPPDCPAPVQTETPKPPKPKKQKRKKKNFETEPTILLFDGNLEDLGILQKSELFTWLWNNEVIVTVPTSSWALHKIETNAAKTIIICDVVISAGVPFYQKQVILNDDNSVSIIIGTSVITQQEQIKFFGSPVELLTLEDLNMLINALHSLDLNAGISNELEGCDVLN